MTSLAASHAAREEFLQQQRQGRRSIPSTPLRSNRSVSRGRKSGNDVVKTAGRFSVPSGDIVLSPSRRTPARSNPEREEKLVSASYWPTVDPEGNPVRWQIRDPFVFNLGAEQQASPRASSPVDKGRESDSSHRKKAKSKRKTVEPVVTYHWGRILSLAGLVLALVFIALPVHLSTSGVVGSFVKLLSPLPFCSSDGSGNQTDCLPCPENAICSEGRMECRRPQFQKQWQHGSWGCVKDNESYRVAYTLMDSLADFLATQRGFHSCDGKSVHPEGMELVGADGEVSVGFSKCYLESMVNRWRKGKTGISEAARQILFEEVLINAEDQERYCIRKASVPSGMVPLDVAACPNRIYSGQIDLYYSLVDKKTVACVAVEAAKAHIPVISVVLICSALLTSLFRRWKLQRTIAAAVRRVISEHTSVQVMKCAAPQQGYAIGPRAHDILNMMRSPRRDSGWAALWKIGRRATTDEAAMYPEYTGISKSLTEADIEKVCDNIVKSDSTFCRSVLAVDMIPFYYSKRVIDRIRLSSPPVTNADSGTKHHDVYI